MSGLRSRWNRFLTWVIISILIIWIKYSALYNTTCPIDLKLRVLSKKLIFCLFPIYDVNAFAGSCAPFFLVNIGESFACVYAAVSHSCKILGRLSRTATWRSCEGNEIRSIFVEEAESPLFSSFRRGRAKLPTLFPK